MAGAVCVVALWHQTCGEASYVYLHPVAAFTCRETLSAAATSAMLYLTADV